MRERGLDPKTPADGAAAPDGDGYTNLEDYTAADSELNVVIYHPPENVQL